MVNKEKKVICAMSGGVDSSVAAALLKNADLNVIGVFMKLIDSASFRESEKSAKKVSSKLKIPFKVLDLRKDFNKIIIKPFLKEYILENTPNPCVNCNLKIKFNLLFNKISLSGKDLLATGHYVVIEKKKNIYNLLKGKDENKDQSYFLWRLSQKELKRTIFPLGYFTKEEVEKMAKYFNLPVLNKKESQEICFIPSDINVFLKKHLKIKPGDIVDVDGNNLGKHPGLVFFTIGQRKGINLPGGPYYVFKKDFKNNLLFVTKSEKDLLCKELKIKDINWISGKKPKTLSEIIVKIRYRDKGTVANIVFSGKIAKIIFVKKQRAITPGQSAVIYKKDRLLGGGIIC